MVVILGVADGSQDEYFNLFDKIFLLQCSLDTLIYRLKMRDTNVFAKTPEEQGVIVEWRKTFDPHLLKQGAISISSEGSVSDVIKRLSTYFEI